MPADGIPRCPSPWNGDIGTSRLEEQLQGRLYDLGLIQKASYWPRRSTNNSAKITDPSIQVGSIASANVALFLRAYLVRSPVGTYGRVCVQHDTSSAELDDRGHLVVMRQQRRDSVLWVKSAIWVVRQSLPVHPQ
jgi:hypothetical protein